MVYAAYVHIPFCKHRCGYCDFATFEDQHDLIDSYVEVLCNEIRQYDNLGHIDGLKTIFFGGGTPSQLSIAHFKKIMDVLAVKSVDSLEEITVEVNPDDASFEFLKGLKDLGVNRISLGVQSFDDEVLGVLDRQHVVSNVFEACEYLKKLEMNFSMDLIYGSPGETMKSWENTVKQCVALDPTHISMYCLSIESGTPLGKLFSKGLLDGVDEDLAVEKYFLADKILANHGYEWYEISNWSKPGFESKHNLAYWQLKPYLGLGLSAHGFINNERYKNSVSLTRYIEDFQVSKNTYEKLSADDLEVEKVVLGLRLSGGVDKNSIPNQGQLQLLLDEKILRINSLGRIVIADSSRLVAHDIISRLT